MKITYENKGMKEKVHRLQEEVNKSVIVGRLCRGFSVYQCSLTESWTEREDCALVL